MDRRIGTALRAPLSTALDLWAWVLGVGWLVTLW
jgi:hypothetical protein